MFTETVAAGTDTVWLVSCISVSCVATFTEVLLPYVLRASPLGQGRVLPGCQSLSCLGAVFSQKKSSPRENPPGSPLFPSELPAQLLLNAIRLSSEKLWGLFLPVPAHAFQRVWEFCQEAGVCSVKDTCGDPGLLLI